jgi:Raf kinase inhibitor-like YbhB/YbcL family protein
MHISSPAFAPEGAIPVRCTCEGVDVSPPLAFDVDDAGAKSLVLVVHDPDAPAGNFAHWLVYNLEPSTHALAEGAAADLPGTARHGTNDFGHVGWSGPCPRAGKREHRYVFTLFALDAELPDLGAPNKATLERAMEGHILGHVQLTGTYALQNRSAQPTA